jgi:hypothetical protein
MKIRPAATGWERIHICICVYVPNMNRQAGRKTDRQTVRRTDRETDGQAGRRTDRETDRQTGRRTDRETDRQVGRRTDRATDRCIPLKEWRSRQLQQAGRAC